MRDLVFKNLTSQDKTRRKIASSEIVDKEGVRNIIRRHFICVVKEVKDGNMQPPAPYLYVLKKRNTTTHAEKFFCRMKGSVYAVANGRLFQVLFMHSLKINLEVAPQDLVK